MNHNQPDIIYVTHEKPNTLSVADIRSQLVNDVDVKPYSSRYKIYIVDEAEKMNQQAQNALLKTIEEPPAYAVIILLTTNADAFLPTILSRCVVHCLLTGMALHAGLNAVLFTLQGLGKCLRQHFLAGFVRSVQYICMGYFIHFYCIL